MASQSQGAPPLVSCTVSEPSSIHTAAGQLAVLQKWVQQYRGCAWPDAIAAKVLSELLCCTAPFDLAACRDDVWRVAEILHAFGGRLACLDAQINGLLEV
jgi:hypothetical protein